jgi:hypothetical protein
MLRNRFGLHSPESMSSLARIGYLGVALAVMLAALALFAPPLSAIRAAGPGGRGALSVLSGVTYENVTLFPVIASGRVDTSGFVTLDQGLASGDVVVREMGDVILRRTRDGRPLPSSQGRDEVNRLVLINRGRKPLLLIAGELVSGGKQDRIIAKDRIVAPGGEPLPLDVFCVEHGRWAGAAQFNASKVIVHPSVREQAVVDQSQTRVWASVREATTAPAAGSAGAPLEAPISARVIDNLVATAAPTESYAKVYRESRLGRSVDAFADELERRFRRAIGAGKEDRLVGVVVAYGGEVAWSDMFASNELFEQYWPKLLRSYVTEALARGWTTEHASLDAAKAFLEPPHGREQVESEPGVYRWRQVTEGLRVEIDLQALPAGLDLHTVNIRRTGPRP